MAFSHNRENLLVVHERTSRQLSLERLPDKTAATVSDQLLGHFQSLPALLCRSLSFDNGTEFALHYRLTDQLGLDTFFCDPHAPWQKGGIENAIGRMRRCLPRKSDLDSLGDDQLQALVRRYNDTPRKCLGFRTPNEVLSDILNRVALQT